MPYTYPLEFKIKTISVPRVTYRSKHTVPLAKAVLLYHDSAEIIHAERI